MDTLDFNHHLQQQQQLQQPNYHMVPSSSPYALTPVKSPTNEIGGVVGGGGSMQSSLRERDRASISSHPHSTGSNIRAPGHPHHSYDTRFSEVSMKEQLTMEEKSHGEYDDFYPEFSNTDKSSESKWIFDTDKGWVPNPNVSPVPCINHHTLYSTHHKKKTKFEQMKSTSEEEFNLLADAPGKGLGAKITAVLGGDVVTVIGSQTGNEPVDTGKEVPPPPAPDFPEIKRPTSSLKRSSPVSPNKKPLVKERKGNYDRDHPDTLSAPSKKDLWKNSTKTESMLWSTVDEEIVDANNQHNIDDYDQYDPSFRGNNHYELGSSENNYHSPGKHHASTSSSSSLSKVHPTTTTLGKQIHHRLPQVPHGKPKRNSLERQNEISLDDRVTRPLDSHLMSSTGATGLHHGAISSNSEIMSSIASFTSQIQSNQQSIYTQQHAYHQQQQGKQSFNQYTDSRSNHGILTSSSTNLPIVTPSTSEQQFIHDAHYDPSRFGKSIVDHMSTGYNLQVSSQSQEPFLHATSSSSSSSFLPFSSGSSMPQEQKIYSSSSYSTTANAFSATATAAPAAAASSIASSSIGSAYPSTIATTLPITSQFQAQTQPPSALRHESKVPGENQKTVTFSEQLHQEVTFNPSNASSPFPINDTIHPSFDTMQHLPVSSCASLQSHDGDVILDTSTGYYNSSASSQSDIIHTSSSTSLTCTTSHITTDLPSVTSSVTTCIGSSLLLDAPSTTLRRSSVSSITGQQQQQQTSQLMTGQLNQQSYPHESSVLPAASVASSTPGDIKSIDTSATTTVTSDGLRDYQPDNVDGLSISRIRWLAAFNKVVAQMNEVSFSAFFTLFALLYLFFLLFSSCYLLLIIRTRYSITDHHFSCHRVILITLT